MLLLIVTDVSTICAVVIFRVRVSCITSVDGSILWLLICLVNYVVMLLVVCQLSRDVIHLAMKTRNQSLVTVKQSSIVSQIVSSPVVLS